MYLIFVFFCQIYVGSEDLKEFFAFGMSLGEKVSVLLPEGEFMSVKC